MAKSAPSLMKTSARLTIGIDNRKAVSLFFARKCIKQNDAGKEKRWPRFSARLSSRGENKWTISCEQSGIFDERDPNWLPIYRTNRSRAIWQSRISGVIVLPVQHDVCSWTVGQHVFAVLRDQLLIRLIAINALNQRSQISRRKEIVACASLTWSSLIPQYKVLTVGAFHDVKCITDQ